MPIDIAFLLNRTLQIPLLVVINSILKNASEFYTDSVSGSVAPLRFNILVSPGDRSFFQAQSPTFFSAISSGKCQNANFRVREFEPPDFLKHYNEKIN